MALAAGVAAQVLFALLVSPRAASEEAEWLPGQSFVEGERAFDDAGCSGCHGVLGKGGGAGPDLGHGRAWGDVMQLAGSLWNHAPVMARTMREGGTGRTPLSADEIGKLAAYLFQLNFVDQPGDVVRGRALFEQQCRICHKIGGEGGKMADKGGALDGVGAKRDAAWLKAYLQDPKSKTPESKMPKMKLSDQQLDDLVAYLLTLATPGK